MNNTSCWWALLKLKINLFSWFMALSKIRINGISSHSSSYCYPMENHIEFGKLTTIGNVMLNNNQIFVISHGDLLIILRTQTWENRHTHFMSDILLIKHWQNLIFKPTNDIETLARPLFCSWCNTNNNMIKKYVWIESDIT